MQMSYDVIMMLFLVMAEDKNGQFWPEFKYSQSSHWALLAHIKEIKIPKIRSI